MPPSIAVLSAGAVKPGLLQVAEAFRLRSGTDTKIDFATAPEIRSRLRTRCKVDVVIAPPEVLEDGAGGETERVIIGRIGIGVMVRSGAPVPTIATLTEFKQALLDARGIIYNRASTGLYLESLFERLELAEQLKPKTTRYPDAGPVLERIAKAADGEIGFGATTVIIASESNGVRLVGPVPEEIQNYTIYAATVMPSSAAGTAARNFVDYLATAEARSIFAAAGIA